MLDEVPCGPAPAHRPVRAVVAGGIETLPRDAVPRQRSHASALSGRFSLHRQAVSEAAGAPAPMFRRGGSGPRGRR